MSCKGQNFFLSSIFTWKFCKQLETGKTGHDFKIHFLSNPVGLRLWVHCKSCIRDFLTYFANITTVSECDYLKLNGQRTDLCQPNAQVSHLICDIALILIAKFNDLLTLFFCSCTPHVSDFPVNWVTFELRNLVVAIFEGGTWVGLMKGLFAFWHEPWLWKTWLPDKLPDCPTTSLTARLLASELRYLLYTVVVCMICIVLFLEAFA